MTSTTFVDKWELLQILLCPCILYLPSCHPRHVDLKVTVFKGLYSLNFDWSFPNETTFQ